MDERDLAIEAVIQDMHNDAGFMYEVAKAYISGWTDEEIREWITPDESVEGG